MLTGLLAKLPFNKLPALPLVAWEEVNIMDGNSLDNDGVHVVPVDDLKEHDIEPTCWCRPLVQHEQHRTLYIHNALDRREMYENAIN